MQYRPEDRVKVQLKVDKSLLGYPGSPSDYYVAVTGSGLQLGNNDPNIAPRCKQVGHNLWMKEIWPPKHSDIKFRFLVVKRSNNVIVDMENTGPRNLSIESNPIIVDVRFNRPRITAKEIDEITNCNRESQYSKRSNPHALSITANIRAHQNVRNQPKYSLKQNTQGKEPKLGVKLMPPVSQRVKDESFPKRKRQEEKQMQKANERPTVIGESAASLTKNDSPPTKAMMACNIKPASTTTAGDIPQTAAVMTTDAGPLTTEMVSNTPLMATTTASNTELMTATTTNNTPLITAATAGGTGSMTTDMAGYTPLMTTTTAADISLVKTATASNSSLITTAIARDRPPMTTATANNTPLITTPIADNIRLITTPTASCTELLTRTTASDIPLMTTMMTSDIPLMTTMMTSDIPLMTTMMASDIPLMTTMMTSDIPLMTTMMTSDIPLMTTMMTSDIPLMTTMMTSSTKQTTAEAAHTSVLTPVASTKRSEEGINYGEVIQKNNLEATVKSSFSTQEESRCTEAESTSPEWRPSTRALLLAAAGVAAATCVGYYYFVKK